MSLLALLGFAASAAAQKIGNNIWHNVKFYIPLEEIKVNITGINSIIITTNFTVDNHYKAAVDLTEVHATVNYKDPDGNLVELANTPPNSKKFRIEKNATSVIKGIQVNAITSSIPGGIKAYFKNPEGERLEIIVSGNANGLSFEKRIWY